MTTNTRPSPQATAQVQAQADAPSQTQAAAQPNPQATPRTWQEVSRDLDSWLASHTDDLVTTVSRLIAVPSVSRPGTGAPGHPFGDACADVIDLTHDLARERGLGWKNYDYYASAITLPGSAEGAQDAPPHVAFFSHVDVVPVGPGWTSDPFHARVKDGWIYGRGANDNKGPATTVLLALAYLRERGLTPSHDTVLYLGSDEEREMEDIRYLVPRIPAADVSLVSDSCFPVTTAEKGIIDAEISARIDDPALVSVEGGIAHNAVPDLARAKVRIAGETREFVARGRAAHAAEAQRGTNAIGLLARQLVADPDVRAALLPVTVERLTAIADFFEGWDGEALGVKLPPDASGPTTCVGAIADYRDGTLTVRLNIRHPVRSDQGAVLDSLRRHAEARGFATTVSFASQPHLANADPALVRGLTGIVNEELGTALVPFELSGGTHARWIPGALGFGPTRSDPDAPTTPGAGKAHAVDEAVQIRGLLEAVRIYVRTILWLDGWADARPGAVG